MIKFLNINYSYHFSPDELMNLFTWLIQNQKQCIFVWFCLEKIIIDKPIPKGCRLFSNVNYVVFLNSNNLHVIIVEGELESWKEN